MNSGKVSMATCLTQSYPTLLGSEAYKTIDWTLATCKSLRIRAVLTLAVQMEDKGPGDYVMARNSMMIAFIKPTKLVVTR